VTKTIFPNTLCEVTFCHSRLESTFYRTSRLVTLCVSGVITRSINMHNRQEDWNFLLLKSSICTWSKVFMTIKIRLQSDDAGSRGPPRNVGILPCSNDSEELPASFFTHKH